ncbi:hypothetical protein TETAUR1a_000149 [Candidatus Hodgkinia cicadicola]|nr:hypothetical protein TETAUR1a_000149 [Candidatus Hodgkinia cicadicola]
MITTILSCVAMQRAADCLVTSCLRPRRAALKNMPAVCVIGTMEGLAKRKMPEVKNREQNKAKTVPQAAVVNNSSEL